MTKNAKMHQNAYFEMALKGRKLLHTSYENFFTHHIRSLKCVQVVENNFFCHE